MANTKPTPNIDEVFRALDVAEVPPDFLLYRERDVAAEQAPEPQELPANKEAP